MSPLKGPHAVITCSFTTLSMQYCSSDYKSTNLVLLYKKPISIKTFTFKSALKKLQNVSDKFPRSTRNICITQDKYNLTKSNWIWEHSKHDYFAPKRSIMMLISHCDGLCTTAVAAFFRNFKSRKVHPNKCLITCPFPMLALCEGPSSETFPLCAAQDNRKEERTCRIEVLSSIHRYASAQEIYIHEQWHYTFAWDFQQNFMTDLI